MSGWVLCDIRPKVNATRHLKAPSKNKSTKNVHARQASMHQSFASLLLLLSLSLSLLAHLL